MPAHPTELLGTFHSLNRLLQMLYAAIAKVHRSTLLAALYIAFYHQAQVA